MKNEYNVGIVFGGFYDSIHSEFIDKMLESRYGDEDGNVSDNIFIENKINYDYIRIRIVKEMIKFLNEKMNTNIKYRKLDSPKEYNFRTDIIETKINDLDIRRIKNFIKEESLEEELEQRVDEIVTERPGYIPLIEKEELYLPENRDRLMTTYMDVIGKIFFVDETNDWIQYIDDNSLREIIFEELVENKKEESKTNNKKI